MQAKLAKLRRELLEPSTGAGAGGGKGEGQRLHLPLHLNTTKKCPDLELML